MLRIDMSEYMEKHSVARLIGAPPGYVGYEEGGSLTEAVRRRPYQVILFDEVEKAHSDVFNILLQVLDDGRLTDGQGHTVDFRNTIIVLTSNLGSEYLAALLEGQPAEAAREQVMEVVRRSFRPEFLNRLDEIILFNRLGRNEMKRIVDIQLKHLQQLLDDRKIVLEVDEKAKAWLANTGYDPVYGARPLKRVIQRELQNPLATMLLSGAIKDGDTVEVSVQDGRLTINGSKRLGTQAAAGASIRKEGTMQRGDDATQHRRRSRRDGGGRCRNARGRECVLARSLLRALADAENTRRRAERPAEDARQYAIADFARELLGCRRQSAAHDRRREPPSPETVEDRGADRRGPSHRAHTRGRPLSASAFGGSTARQAFRSDPA